jgi:putative transport protein
MMVGEESPEDLTLDAGPLTSRQVLVTRPEVVGKSLGELRERYPLELKATRLTRADLDMNISPTLRLRFGDVLTLVGTEENLDRAAQVLGNSIKEMHLVRLVPLFLGIALGVLVGCYPFTVGNMPAPLRLGLVGMCGSEAPSVSYAAVYPLTMVLRIAAAQLLVLLFAS